MVPLSILDLSVVTTGTRPAAALRNSIDLARHADALGYVRYWLAEHHNLASVASPAPDIMIGQIAAVTSRIRVGSGGVMLPNHAPLVVAERFKMLEALFPGRIDLGLGRAPGTDGATAYALRSRLDRREGDDFLERLHELTLWETRDFPPNHPYNKVVAMPDDVPLPPIWLLGSSDYSANLAAELGLSFAFAGHFSLEAPEGPLGLYRERFRPGALEKPHAILALSVFCAESDAAAARMAASVLLSFAQLRAGRAGRMPSPDEALTHVYTPEEQATVALFSRLQIIGTPERVRAAIEQVAESTGADEVMLATHAFDPAARVRSYE